MTKAEIEQMIDLYLTAEKEILEGKEISFQGRTMKHENLKEIRDGRASWEQRLTLLQQKGRIGSLVRFT